ncbi:CPBP family intramembrane glutamic endopeptidase [Fuchsiella alkaliacetigena]|uniref:CPBP family intramembrane glutamic endopeptidase n=1 Tax=Fuchsiella alkaliacetigena TaxID=957042 RepID=UPI00200B839D|nr:type II CAAX endopeptidase family protein [Fuchsiella alkaliacetigena]MCK8823472.1 CPBP family intramembrane metalloprotease [Fuchsiella alkaliacetigena]
MLNSPGRNYVCWQGRDLLFIILGTIGVTLLLGSILTFLIEQLNLFPSLAPYKPIIINLLQFIAILVTSLLVLAKYDLSLQVLGFRAISFKKAMLWGVFGGTFVCLLVLAGNVFLQRIVESWWGLEIPSQPIIEQLLSSEDSTIFVFYAFLIVVVAPIVEEIFFRGILYQYCKKKLGFKKGALLAAFIFAIAHFNLWTFLATFLGGLSLIILYEFGKSMYIAIIAHATWNSIMIIIVYFIWRNKLLI